MRSIVLTAMLVSLSVAACGRNGPPEREPGASIPDISQPLIKDETTKPTKPRTTLF